MNFLIMILHISLKTPHKLSWRCKAYGHRTGDRECPLALQGNVVLDAQRQVLPFFYHLEFRQLSQSVLN